MLFEGTLSHLGYRHERTFRVSTRDGVIVEAPNRPLAWGPLVEILAGDAYRLRSIVWDTKITNHSVLDIGAHVGSFTCALAKQLPDAKFTCVEPSPTSRDWLIANLEANQLAHRTIVVPAAVGPINGLIDLWQTEPVSYEATTQAPGSRRHKTQVDCLTFESLLAIAGNHVDIVKFDCEGAEYQAVLPTSPATWLTVDRVFLEYHPVQDHTFDELIFFFSQVGLDLIWHQLDPEIDAAGLAHFARKSHR